MSSSGNLLGTVGSARLHPYVRCTDGSDRQVEQLYRWNTRLSLGLFDDIGVVEVALRNAISSQLKASHGNRWFDDWTLFDDGTMAVIESAKLQSGFSSLHADDDVRHGKLVASLMLGFWVKLLGKGSFQGITRKSLAPVKKRMIYDTVLWKASLHKGFVGAGPTERASVERPAAIVKEIRNRVAHHESAIWGIPLPGQQESDGTSRRLSVNQARRSISAVAELISPELSRWIAAHSQVGTLIEDCPTTERSRFRL